MEATVRSSGLHWTILRGGAFYGPGTGRDDFWRAQAREGNLRLPGDGQAFISLVHVADFADAIVRALIALSEPDVIAVVDESPVKYADLFDHIAAIENGPSPEADGPPLWPSFRIVNDRAKSKLDWRPRYASYRSGFV
jgi:nucleoside-diphosphate-sugar epimerase